MVSWQPKTAKFALIQHVGALIGAAAVAILCHQTAALSVAGTIIIGLILYVAASHLGGVVVGDASAGMRARARLLSAASLGAAVFYAAGARLPIQGVLGRQVAVTLLTLLLVDTHLAGTTPRFLRRVGRARVTAALLVIMLGTAGSLAVLGPLPILNQTVLLPAWVAYLPSIMLLAGSATMMALRVRCLHRAPSPALASQHIWNLVGLLLTVLTLSASLPFWMHPAAYLSDELLRYDFGRVALVFAMLVQPLAFRAAIDPALRSYEGRSARALFRVLLALAAGSCLLAVAFGLFSGGKLRVVVRLIQGHGLSSALLGALCAIVAMAAYRGSHNFAIRRLAPMRGALLKAINLVEKDTRHTTVLEDLARSCLVHFRAASGKSNAEPVLYLCIPGRELRLDLAGLVHTRQRRMPSALTNWLSTRLGTVLVAREFLSRPRDNTEEAELAEFLELSDALAVLPLVAEEQLTGAVVIPRGNRRGTMTSEELSALQELAVVLAARLSLMLFGLRSVEQVGALKIEQERLEQQTLDLTLLLEETREECNALRATKSTLASERTWIAYSPAMRELEFRAGRVASVDVPLLLTAEPGTDIEDVAWHIHEASPQREGPWVIADCTQIDVDAVAEALFGADILGTNILEKGPSENGTLRKDAQQQTTRAKAASRGWLELADSGTLVLLNLPALPEAAQYALAVALSTKVVRSNTGAKRYDMNARVVASALSPSGAPDGAARLHPKLRSWFASGSLRIPPLRKRSEDINSLALIEIDRACRMLGRSTVGIESLATEALRTYHWPGNLDEFRRVIWNTVGITAGPVIKREELPPHIAQGTSERASDIRALA